MQTTDVNEKFWWGLNEGEWDMAREALEEGADPNYISPNVPPLEQYLPLVSVLDLESSGGDYNNMYDMAEALLKAGADPNRLGLEPTYWGTHASNAPGSKPLEMLIFVPDNEEKQDLLRIATLLLDYGAIPNAKLIKRANEVFPELGKLLNEGFVGEQKIKKRRELIGEPEAMKIYAAEILEVPGGRKERARRASTSGFKTEIEKKSALCNELENELYKEELLELAREFDLPVTKRMKKKELCKLLADYAEPYY